MVGLKTQDPLPPPPGACLKSGENTGALRSPEGKDLVGVASAGRSAPPKAGGGC